MSNPLMQPPVLLFAFMMAAFAVVVLPVGLADVMRRDRNPD